MSETDSNSRGDVPGFATPRLLLRPYDLEDVDELLAILGDAETMRFWPQPFTRDEVVSWIEGAQEAYRTTGMGRYAVELKDRDGIIGDCGVMPLTVDGQQVHDLGYIIHRDWWGNHYATEAAATAVLYAFENGIKEVHANMPADHVAARRVAENLQMTLVRQFRNPRNRYIETVLYVRGPPD